MKQKQVFRIAPTTSKKKFERFHAVLQGAVIEQVQATFTEDGQIEKVDIIYEYTKTRRMVDTMKK